MLTRTALLTDTQRARLTAGLAAREEHLAVEVTAAIYQELIDAYDQPRKRDGKVAMYKVLRSIRAGVPAGLGELAQLGRSLWAQRSSTPTAEGTAQGLVALPDSECVDALCQLARTDE